jgi:hypothetical protein
VVRRADHQGRQVEHLGPGLFEQAAGRPQLLFRPGDGNAATLERALGWAGGVAGVVQF